MQTTYAYNDADVLTGESYSGGTLASFSLGFGYDSSLRRNAFGANTSASLSYSYAYDTAGRLQSVTAGTGGTGVASRHLDK